MRKSRLSRSIQEKLIEHFVASTTARCAASLAGVNFKTACYYFQRLREIIIAEQLEAESHEVLMARSRSTRVVSVARVRVNAVTARRAGYQLRSHKRHLIGEKIHYFL
jgi:transposase-like protein